MEKSAINKGQEQHPSSNNSAKMECEVHYNDNDDK